MLITYLYYLIFSNDTVKNNTININVSSNKTSMDDSFQKPQAYKNINSNSITNL